MDAEAYQAFVESSELSAANRRSGEASMAETGLSLTELEAPGEFVRRHIGPDEAEIEAMLEVVGAASLDDLIERATPRRDPHRAAARRCRRPMSEDRGAGGPARDRRAQPRADLDDRHGLLRHRSRRR